MDALQTVCLFDATNEDTLPATFGNTLSIHALIYTLNAQNKMVNLLEQKSKRSVSEYSTV